MFLSSTPLPPSPVVEKLFINPASTTMPVPITEQYILFPVTNHKQLTPFPVFVDGHLLLVLILVAMYHLFLVLDRRGTLLVFLPG